MIDEHFVESLPRWLRGSVFDVEYWQYLALLVILLFGLVLRNVIRFVAKNRLRKLVEAIGHGTAARLVDVFASPGATLVVALVLRVAYPHLMLPKDAQQVLAVCVRILVVLSVILAGYRLVDVLVERMLRHASATASKLDDQLVPLVSKLLKAFVVLAGVLAVLQNMDVNIASLLAGLGIGGVAVALAAKDTIANFFGGIMIFVDRPFQIGDSVVIAGIEGVIEEVGFRSTRIRTPYDSIVTVPNAKFTEANIDNTGQRTYRRTSVTLRVRYDTTPEQIQAFCEGIRAIVRANAYTRKDAYEVHMAGFGEHSIHILVQFFFQGASASAEHRERHYVFLEIMRLARELGVGFAFPTQTLHVERLAASAPYARPEVPSLEALTRAVHAFGPDGTSGKPRGSMLTDGYFAAVPRP